MKEHGGDGFIKNFIKRTKQYKDETSATAKDEMEDNAFNHWTAYLFICNSDNKKYGSLKQELR